MKTENRMNAAETDKLLHLSFAVNIIWAVTVLFSRIGNGTIFKILSWVSLAAAVILFVVLAVKVSFLSFLKLSFGLGLIAAFWALLYRYMYYARGAFWIAAVFVIGLLAAGVCWLLIRLFGLQHLY